MNPNTFPTKGNLILAKNSLALGRQGFELMDKKRNILIHELMDLIDKAQNIQTEIDSTFSEAYKALQRANIEMGIHNVQDISKTIPEESSVRIKQRSIMGVEIPLVDYDANAPQPHYSFYNTRIALDEATAKFKKVKDLTIRLSMIENSAYRLATSISQTQRRANALKNITIPYYSGLVSEIGNALEEKEREEFTRLKVIKSRKESSS
jgi:V/A-type H+/Na+-transporting ATPase subunit D